MVIETIANSPTDVVSEVVAEVGRIGLWLQTLGIIVILWIIFQTVNFWINRKRKKALSIIQSDLNRIEKKVDRILKKK